MTPRLIAQSIREKLGFSYARSGGPGGQNVNKVASKVLARLPLSALSFLPPDSRLLVEMRLANRINADGEIVLAVQDTREQTRNREIAVERLAELIAVAMRVPKKRHRTRPTGASREARLRMKKLRSAAKRFRRVDIDD